MIHRHHSWETKSKSHRPGHRMLIPHFLDVHPSKIFNRRMIHVNWAKKKTWIFVRRWSPFLLVKNCMFSQMAEQIPSTAVFVGWTTTYSWPSQLPKPEYVLKLLEIPKSLIHGSKSRFLYKIEEGEKLQLSYRICLDRLLRFWSKQNVITSFKFAGILQTV